MTTAGLEDDVLFGSVTGTDEVVGCWLPGPTKLGPAIWMIAAIYRASCRNQSCHYCDLAPARPSDVLAGLASHSWALYRHPLHRVRIERGRLKPEVFNGRDAVQPNTVFLWRTC